MNNKKILFPAGIFLILFLIELLLGTIALAGYSYITLKKNISGIEAYTLSYSKTMAEAFAGVAELSIKTKKFDSLKTLFHEKIQQNTIDEAIFVLADGRLIVHSNTFIEKGLRGNIANDEMAYNLELILEPVVKKSTALFFNNYNIINSKIPFSRREKEIIEKYIYPGISTSGWLFSRGVFINNEPAGSVCFIVSKNRIYGEIQETKKRIIKIWYIMGIASLVISFLVSLVVLGRYRSIQKRAAAGASSGREKDSCKTAAEPVIVPEETESGTRSADDSEAEIPAVPAGSEFEEYIDDPDSGRIVEKDYDIPVLPDSHGGAGSAADTLNSAAVTGDEGYITVELLGEINDEPSLPETVMSATGEYIARAIPAETLKNIEAREIRDAIPAGTRKR